MPFTFSHPAAIIPFRRFKFLSSTGLVVGSMVPDFEFFLRMREIRTIGHQPEGILYFDVPLGLLICLLFHFFIRDAFLAHLPPFITRKWNPQKKLNWNKHFFRNAAGIIVSLIIGISTHLFLDSITHSTGYFPTIFPVLLEEFSLFGFQIPLYFQLQIAFSVLGLIVLFTFHHQRKEKRAIQTKGYSWIQYYGIWGIIMVGILAFRLYYWPELNTRNGVVIAIMGSILYSWLILSLFYKYIRTKKHTHGSA